MHTRNLIFMVLVAVLVAAAPAASQQNNPVIPAVGAGLPNCADGEILVWTAGAAACTDPATLPDSDTLRDLNCVAGQVAQYDGTDWVCFTPLVGPDRFVISDQGPFYEEFILTGNATELSFLDTGTISFGLFANAPGVDIDANVKIDPNPNNIITAGPNGLLVDGSAISGSNIYTADGVATGDRIYDGDNNYIQFTNLDGWQFSTATGESCTQESSFFSCQSSTPNEIISLDWDSNLAEIRQVGTNGFGLLQAGQNILNFGPGLLGGSGTFWIPTGTNLTPAGPDGPFAFSYTGDASALGGSNPQASLGIQDPATNDQAVINVGTGPPYNYSENVQNGTTGDDYTMFGQPGQWNFFADIDATSQAVNFQGNANTPDINLSANTPSVSVNVDIDASLSEFRVDANNGVNFVQLQLEALGDFLIVDAADVLFQDYPETRNDSGATFPQNFLYTDFSGSIKSSPRNPLVTPATLGTVPLVDGQPIWYESAANERAYCVYNGATGLWIRIGGTAVGVCP